VSGAATGCMWCVWPALNADSLVGLSAFYWNLADGLPCEDDIFHPALRNNANLLRLFCRHNMNLGHSQYSGSE
jgi:hypothetical protein